MDLYLSGMWSDVHPRMDIKRHTFKREWTMCSKYVNHSRLNSQHDWEGGGREPIWPLNEHKEPLLWQWIKYFMSSIVFEECKYICNLDLVTISQLSKSRRSGLEGINYHWRPIHLTTMYILYICFLFLIRSALCNLLKREVAIYITINGWSIQMG